MTDRYGDAIRPKSEKCLVALNNFNYTLNRIGLCWIYTEMRGKQKYYIRFSKSMPEDQKWYGAQSVSFAYLKRKY